MKNSTYIALSIILTFLCAVYLKNITQETYYLALTIQSVGYFIATIENKQ